ncbi:MAG: phage major capsid protein [Nanoarchaeota archaeon]|nr:phage major capsid protein [Nanoarchaeota archaeon]
MAFKKIKEYISTDDATAGTLLIPQTILATLIEETDKNLLDRSLARFVLGPSQIPGSQISVNLNVHDTGKIREVGEGAEIPLDAGDYEAVTFTPVKFGVSIRITGEMMEDSQFPLLQDQIRTFGRRFAENETKLILTSLDGANITITGGASITVANITTGMQNLWDEDFSPSDIIVGAAVLNDIMNIDTFAEADKWGGVTANQTGQIGRIYGMNLHLFSRNAAPATNYNLRAYILDRREAFAIAIKRDITVENVMLPLFDMEGAVITQRIDVQLLKSRAVTLITTT